MIRKLTTILLSTIALSATPPTLFLQDYYFSQFPSEAIPLNSSTIIQAEMIAHVPLLGHEGPKTLLIIGDSNGAILHEALKHPTLEKIHLVAFTLPASTDPRVIFTAEDPARFVKKCSETFDVILCDDPQGSSEFYANCKDLLNKRGIFVNKENNLSAMSAIRAPHFKHTTYYLASTSQGQIAFGWASDKKYRVSESILEARLAKIKEPMLYYTPEVHRAAFALPNFILSFTK
jgi:spermidine synthase